MVRKSLDYQGIARRAVTTASSSQKRRFEVIDRAVQKAREEITYDTEIDTGSTKEENMKFKPLHDHVIVTRAKAEDVSKGGIYIPPTAQEKTSEGVVVAVGSGIVLENGTVRPLDVKPGDKVLFDKYAGGDVTIHGEEFVVMRENGIICILDR